MKQVVLVTDGACLGNPGPGGWAALLRCGPRERELTGGEPRTTNNRMELTAVLEGLRALHEPCQVEIVTDSQYVSKGVTEWMGAWKRMGWRTAAKKPVKNQDLWAALDLARGEHQVKWKWVKGHASDADNLRVDRLAQEAARREASRGRA